MGEVRKWSSLAFVASSVVSAWMPHWGAGHAGLAGGAGPGSLGGRGLQWSADHMAQMLMVLAGFLNPASFLCFRQIRVEEDLSVCRRDSPQGLGSSSRTALRVLTLMESGIDFMACDNPHANRFTIHILAAAEGVDVIDHDAIELVAAGDHRQLVPQGKAVCYGERPALGSKAGDVVRVQVEDRFVAILPTDLRQDDRRVSLMAVGRSVVKQVSTSLEPR